MKRLTNLLRYKKFGRIVIGITIGTLLVLIYYYMKERPAYGEYKRLFELENLESRLKVKNENKNDSYNSDDGVGIKKEGRYVKFKQLRGAGFNNQVQDILLYHTLAITTGRTYAYLPFVWRPRGEKAFIPLSAFLKGVTKDGISEKVFNEDVCKEEEVVHVTLGRVSYEGQWERAVEVLSGNERCMVVDDWIFNWKFLTTSGLHSVWPAFRKYLNDKFEWSQPIYDITDRVQNKLGLGKDGDEYMALHLRRGDFETHCEYLAQNSVGFTTWATLPDFESSILPPKLDTTNASSIQLHCYPPLQRILSAISYQALHHPHARTLYILHDGAIDHPSVYLQFYKLKEAVMNDIWARRHGWPGGAMKRVIGSGDVGRIRKWGKGESDYSVGVDVELARRAKGGFIGNGYSSLSTQIAALRVADGSNGIIFV